MARWKIKNNSLELFQKVTSKMVTANTLHDSVNLLLPAIREHLSASAVTILLYDSQSQQINNGFTNGLTQHLADQYCNRLVSGALAGQIFASLNTVHLTSNYGLKDIGISTILGLKLSAREKVLGSIFAGFRELRHFVSKEIEQLEVLAQHFAIALDNVRLYENSKVERDQREEFVSVITHDLRNPLTVVKASAEILSRDSSKPHLNQNLAKKIINSVIKADKMIRDLLDVNRIKAGERLPTQFQEVDLRDVVNEVVAELDLIYGDRFVIDADGPVIGNWSPDQLLRAIENLATNAVKYGASKAPIVISLNQADGIAEVAVHNRGNAITPEEQEALFQPFHRTSSALGSGKNGWGLGLFLIRGVVEAHHGKVRVESTPDDGTTFTITLPKNAQK